MQALDESSVPELQRTQLAGTLLLLKAAGIDNVMTYAWVSPPPAEAVVRALEQLYALGAINEDAKCVSVQPQRSLCAMHWTPSTRAHTTSTSHQIAAQCVYADATCHGCLSRGPHARRGKRCLHQA